jgi:ABC-type sugar transport system substrate-binding protein
MTVGKRIAFIHHSRQSESSVDIGLGVEIACDLLGYELCAYDPDFDQGRRRECVEEAVAAEPDLIVAAVVTPSLLPDLFEAVAERGIPWIEVGARQAPAHGLTAQAVPDEEALTALLDRWLIDSLAARLGPRVQANVGAWIASALGEGLLARDARRAGDFAAEPHVREVYIHDIALTDLPADIRSSTMVAMRQHPGLHALWQTCEPCVATQAATLDEMGLQGDDRPLIVGFYSNRQTRRLVAEGRVAGLVQVDTRVQGLAAIDLAVQHWHAGTPWPAIEADPIGAYGGALGQPWMITAETVGDDPAHLSPPGPDPVDFFRRRWQPVLNPPSP